MAERSGAGGQRERVRQLLEGAVVEATRRGASTIEAEHVLLALALDADGPSRSLLAEAGLDYEGVRAALEAERQRSLAVVGIPAGFEAALAFTPGGDRPHWGTSIRSAISHVRHDVDARDARQRGRGARRPAGRPGEQAGTAADAWLAATEAWSAAAEADTPDRAAASRAAVEARRHAEEVRRSLSGPRRPAADNRRWRLDDLDILVGVLGNELGTVPRALAIAGVDRTELLARVRSARDGAYTSPDQL